MIERNIEEGQEYAVEMILLIQGRMTRERQRDGSDTPRNAAIKDIMNMILKEYNLTLREVDEYHKRVKT